MTNTTSKTFLLEIYNEEIPTSMQECFLLDSKACFMKEMASKNINILQDVHMYINPCRIAIMCKMIDQSSQSQIIKGPKITAGEEAKNGFMRKHNVQDSKSIVEKDGYYFLQITTSEDRWIADIQYATIQFLHKASNLWGKRMKWNNSGVKWVRPIHKIICMLNQKVLPIEFAGIVASNQTYINRKILFANPNNAQYITIDDAQNYLEKMVNIDFSFSTGNITQKTNQSVIEINKSFTKSSNQQEWKKNWDSRFESSFKTVESPFVLYNCMDVSKYQEVPMVFLEFVMQEHQFYQPLESIVINEDTLQKIEIHQFFVPEQSDCSIWYNIVTDRNTIINKANVQKILENHNRVLRARFDDIKFFFEKDKAMFSKLNTEDEDSFVKVTEMLSKMSTGLSQNSTLLNRCENIYQIAISFAEKYIENFDISSKYLQKYIYFSQLDLATNVVTELPELQGVVGMIYWNIWWGKQCNNINLEDFGFAIMLQYNIQIANNLTQLPLIFLLAKQMDYVASNFLEKNWFNASSDQFGLKKCLNFIIGIIYPKQNKTNNLFQISIEEIWHQLPLKLIKTEDSLCEITYTHLKQKVYQNGLDIILMHAKQNSSFQGLDEQQMCSTWNNYVFSLQNNCDFIESTENAIRHLNEYSNNLFPVYKRIKKLLLSTGSDKSSHKSVETEIDKHEVKQLFDYIENIIEKINCFEESSQLMEVISNFSIFLEQFLSKNVVLGKEKIIKNFSLFVQSIEEKIDIARFIK